MEPTVLESLDDGLLTITLNRPERRNAMSPDITESAAGGQRRRQNPEVRAVLLTAPAARSAWAVM